MSAVEPKLNGAKCVKKFEKPILTDKDVPYDACLVFNAGVAKIGEKYVMIFRNDHGTTYEKFLATGKWIDHTSLGVAVSDNGIDGWRVKDKPICDYYLRSGEELQRLYDPRLTVIDGKNYLCLAMDTRHGIRGCIAEIDESFENINIISASVPDNRNMVLFPEKINGYYYRLERPFPVYGRGRADRFDIWCSRSPDLRFWGDSELVLGVEQVPFSNDKIGPAAPPVKTEKGWLTLFHAVDIDESRGKNGWEKKWPKRYTVGVMLLDLNDPTKVVGMSKEPLMVPDLDFETEEGFRQNVLFPGGLIAEQDGTVKIYYGASDTCECLATSTVDELVALCTEKP